MAPPASAALLGPPVATLNTNTAAASVPKPTRRLSSSSEYSSSDDDDMPMEFVGGLAAKEAPRSGRSLAYASSGDPCVDFFFKVVPGATSGADMAALLDVAWSRDAHAALRFVCHLRGVRGLGKGDREGFYAAALWMHARHPKTLAGNLATFTRFGCLKDLPEILYRVLHGDRMEEEGDPRKQQQDGRHGTKRRRSDGEFQAAKEKKRQEEAQLARTALARYESDETFRFLYDRVAEMFAEMLKSDVEHLRAGETAKIGLAAKWCPSLRSSYDRATLLCEAIARRIFPRESSQEYLNISDKHYAYRVRDRLRREVLVPLRKALDLPEVYMCSCKFKELPYARVASVAMRKYKEVFQKHDKHRVTSFFDEVRTGHARMPADGVLPHELITGALKGEHDEVAELQWRRMVASLSAEGLLANCIAVCGLSGAAAAVADQPASAAIALGLLISELSQEPWKGRVITFDETHQLHKVHGTNLKEKLRPLVAAMGAHKKGANLQGVFSKILQLAVAGGLRKDMMVKRVFVLSDMDFDGWTGASSAWKTEYQGICDKFAAEGFSVPQVVFWNVGTSKASMPVVAAQEGAALVSGYSKNLVRLFLEADGELTPAAVVADAISGPEYDALEVFD
ncbi:hypothetical protein SEVIR_6G117100v4 [Setaria viridis]|uniref:TROVE domain-containing protein n=2 Tax=Setaria TaxID=4554 RepID=A0A368RKI3_SETIT|nr:uncharacterized protein LOC101784776 [Setaria italica]XP_034601200.1 uncharacterized protein LOC117861766 [Setaria viridis]RCV30578.1 hypothetical protein SETIT_6G106900v2 [Setaria italica]TKW09657.1 hypothetical protein SEVIR_6G117100v2 [Setaria viridis]